MREMPARLDAALSLAVQQQSVETAQQRLFKEIHRGDAVAMALQQCSEEGSSLKRNVAAAQTQLRSSRSRGYLPRRQGQRGKVVQHAGNVASAVMFVGTALSLRPKFAQKEATGRLLQPITQH